ncbi:MAG: 50S ribosomal protein L4 [Rickettsiales bacterium]|nr:50S ribosomal protein L4 [Rickettsiales bacterium]OUV82727.1 MAG: 50S ribosomal protein L4 [Rickettsiales bacterium TMED131]
MSKAIKFQIVDLDNKKKEDIDLPSFIFSTEIKEEIVAKVVNWQLLKRRQGSHKVKERNEIVGSNAKIYRQKGTGRARHGSKKVVQFKGGGVVHGPKVRSHEKKIPSKLKKQAIRILLSSKLKEGKLKIIDKFEVKSIKTKNILDKFNKLGIKSATFVEGGEVNKNFLLSARNVKEIDLLSINGLNAYQILKRDSLIVSSSAIKEVVKRYGNE